MFSFLFIIIFCVVCELVSLKFQFFPKCLFFTNFNSQMVHTSGSRIKGVHRFSVSDRIDVENPFVSYEVRLCMQRNNSIIKAIDFDFFLLLPRVCTVWIKLWNRY